MITDWIKKGKVKDVKEDWMTGRHEAKMSIKNRRQFLGEKIELSLKRV